jgi:hypothetical protein
MANAKSASQSGASAVQEIFPIHETVHAALDAGHQAAVAAGTITVSAVRAGVAVQEEMLKSFGVWLSGAERTYFEATKAARVMSERIAESGGDGAPFQREIERWNEMTLDGMKKSMELFSMPFRNAAK